MTRSSLLLSIHKFQWSIKEYVLLIYSLPIIILLLIIKKFLFTVDLIIDISTK